MDQKIVYIEILDDLKNVFKGKIDKRIESIRLVHSDSVYLEIYRTEVKNKRIETIIRNDLSIIINDPETEDLPMFSINEDIEKNLDLLLLLDEYTIINTTDLFDDSVSDKIDKRYRLFRGV